MSSQDQEDVGSAMLWRLREFGRSRAREGADMGSTGLLLNVVAILLEERPDLRASSDADAKENHFASLIRALIDLSSKGDTFTDLQTTLVRSRFLLIKYKVYPKKKLEAVITSCVHSNQ